MEMDAPIMAVGQSSPTPCTAADWTVWSRSWTAAASAQAGLPPLLTLLPSAPHHLNPAWQRAPSWAAAALLVPPPADMHAGLPPNCAPTDAEVAAAAALAKGAGLAGRTLWTLGARSLFFVQATPYPHFVGLAHRQRDLLPITLSLLQPPATEGGSARSSNAAAAAADKQGQQQRWQEKQAAALFREIAANQQPWALRLLGFLLSHLFRWLFNGEIYVDTAGLQRLRALHEQHAGSSSASAGGNGATAATGRQGAQQGGQQVPGGACVVYIPAHKSHLDYLMLSYVLFATGLPCPHIAAGANLSLPLVGRLLRACGAFFIRRTSRGAPDSQLYKAVLAAYVHALLRAGHSLEFFIEGGRTRDGRVNPAKLGMLRMVVDAAAAGDMARPVFIVPTAMNYDALLEERSLAAQLAGAAKRGESLGGLASTCWSILAKALRSRRQRRALGLGAGGYCGRATVAFGPPISLQAWLQQHHGGVRAAGAAPRHAVAALGDQVTAGIRGASVLPTTALLVGALFAGEHATPQCSVAAAAAAAIGIAAEPAGLVNGRECVAGLNGRASTSSMAAPDVLGGMDWLAAELEQRGAAVVRLPRGGHPACSGEGGPASGRQQQARQTALLLHLACMLSRCCAVSTSAEAGSASGGRSGQAQPTLGLMRGVEASLLQHSRLNQLLPWLAAEGLLVAALLGVSRGRADTCGSGGSGAAAESEVLEAAAWLRCLLAPEIDTALGPAALRSPADYQPALQRLLSSSAVVKTESHSGPILHLAATSSNGSRRAALLAAALLAPLLATYCEALRAMLGALAAAGSAGASTKQLCSAAQAHLLELAAGGSSGSGSAGQASAALVVPSTALVQGALRSFDAMGLLTPAGSAAPASCAAAAAAAGGEAAGKGIEPAGALQALAAESQTEAGAGELEAAPSSRSGDSGVGGALDEEYSVDAGQLLTPPGSPAAALDVGNAQEGSSRGRRSFERRRQQRRVLGGGDGAGRSASASDSDLDPSADSVSANLCRLGSPNPRPVPQAAEGPTPVPSSPPTAAAAASTLTAAAAASTHTAAAAGHHSHSAPHSWVLGQPEDVARHLADRIESFICI